MDGSSDAHAGARRDGVAGYPVHRMTSGAGHDAMILAGECPAAMLFLRSPGGISHHPDETVLPEDVEAALAVGAAISAKSWRRRCLIWSSAAERWSLPRACVAADHRDRRRPHRGHRARSLPGAAERDRRPRPARLSRPDRRSPALQRARPRRLGRRRHRQPRAGGRRRHAVLRHAAQLLAVHRRTRASSTQSARRWNARRSPISRCGAASFPAIVGDMAELAERGVVGFKAFLCDSGLPEFPRADDLTLYEGMREAARLGLPVAVHAESRGDDAGLAHRARRAGPQRHPRLSGFAPGARRSRSHPARHPAGAAKPAPSCTSCTSAPAAAWLRRWKRARAAWMSRSKPARTTCSSPKRTWTALGASPNARRRCAPPPSATRCGPTLLARRDRHRGSDHSPAPPAMKQARISFASGAASPVCNPRWRCCWNRALRARLAARTDRRAAGRQAGAALSHRAQGPHRGGQRRRSRAGGSGSALHRCSRRTCFSGIAFSPYVGQQLSRRGAPHHAARRNHFRGRSHRCAQPRPAGSAADRVSRQLMQHLGHTRSAQSAAIICLHTPDTFVRAPLPGMRQGHRHRPRRARGGRALHAVHRGVRSRRHRWRPPPASASSTCWKAKSTAGGAHARRPSDYAYLPAGMRSRPIAAAAPARAAVIEKPYQPLPGVPAPALLHRRRKRHRAGTPLMGDDGAGSARAAARPIRPSISPSTP